MAFHPSPQALSYSYYFGGAPNPNSTGSLLQSQLTPTFRPPTPPNLIPNPSSSSAVRSLNSTAAAARVISPSGLTIGSNNSHLSSLFSHIGANAVTNGPAGSLSTHGDMTSTYRYTQPTYFPFGHNVDQSHPLYHSLAPVAPYGLPDGRLSPSTVPYASWKPTPVMPSLTQGVCHYDTAYAYSSNPYQYSNMAGYPGNLHDSSRRKNATRESTSTLKAWLHEHIQNPYPTKGEKIMLAIITKMTLTQVSTWFANARRRLKKENRMTWSPKGKSDQDSEGPSNTSREEVNDIDKIHHSLDSAKSSKPLTNSSTASLHHNFHHSVVPSAAFALNSRLPNGAPLSGLNYHLPGAAAAAAANLVQHHHHGMKMEHLQQSISSKS